MRTRSNHFCCLFLKRNRKSKIAYREQSEIRSHIITLAFASQRSLKVRKSSVEGRKVMSQVLSGVLLAFSLAAAGLAMAGCDSQPEFDVSRYFGKTEEEIVEMLGEPTEREMLSPGAGSFCISYLEESKIPPPLWKTFKICFSEAGLSYHFRGQTRGYDTPDELLTAVGLGGLQKEETGRDQLGVTYSIPPYELVQVHRPSSHVIKYTLFNTHDFEAGTPK